MNCAEFETLLFDSIAGRKPAAAMRMHEHAIACQTCRARCESQAWLDSAIVEWSVDVPEIELGNGVLAQLESKPLRQAGAGDALPASSPMQTLIAPNRRRPRNTSMQPAAAIVIALAACVIIMMFSPLMQPTGPLPQSERVPTIVVTTDDSAETQIAASDTREPAADESAEPQAELESLALDAGEAYAALANQAADAASDGISLVAPVPAGSTSLAAAESGLENLPNWVDRWEREFQPFRSNLSSALDKFLDVVPADPTPAL